MPSVKSICTYIVALFFVTGIAVCPILTFFGNSLRLNTVMNDVAIRFDIDSVHTYRNVIYPLMTYTRNSSINSSLERPST